MSLFEQLLEEYGVFAERFVKFKIPLKADAEDVLQEVYALAYQNFAQLKNVDSFKFWLLSIAGISAMIIFVSRQYDWKYPLKHWRKNSLPIVGTV